ncbi:hypothetical protein M1307_03250 [Patescibacteria group bacterium]|nr:hypothetical protein [Patescibacteria group bacterium]
MKKRKSGKQNVHRNFSHLEKKNKVIEREEKSLKTIEKMSSVDSDIHGFSLVKKEIGKNIFFIVCFLAFALTIYFLIEKTNILNPFLKIFGLSGIY